MIEKEDMAAIYKLMDQANSLLHNAIGKAEKDTEVSEEQLSPLYDLEAHIDCSCQVLEKTWDLHPFTDEEFDADVST